LSSEVGLLDGGLDRLGNELTGFILRDVLLLFEVLEIRFDIYAHGCGGVLEILGTKKAGPNGPTSMKGDCLMFIIKRAPSVKRC
jgi:hypothetical protein